MANIQLPRTILFLMTCIVSYTGTIEKNNNGPLLPPSLQTLTLKQTQELHTLACDQLTAIETIFDAIGQALSNNTVKKEPQQKKQLQQELISLRKEIGIMRDASSLYLDSQQLYTLALVNEELINLVHNIVKHSIETIPTFNIIHVIKRSKQAQALSTHSIAQKIAHNQKRLDKVTQEAEKLGLSALNKTYRALRKFSRDWHIYPVAEHTAVYVALFFWSVYLTSDWRYINNLPNNGIGGLYKRLSLWAKKKVGQPEFPTEDFYKTDALLLKETGKKIALDGKDMPEYEIKKSPDIFVHGAAPRGAKVTPLKDHKEHSKIVSIDPRQIKDYDNVMMSTHNIEHTQGIKGSESTHGAFNKFFDLAAPLVDFNVKGTLFKWPINAFFNMYLIKDAQKVGRLIVSLKKYADDRLYGVTRKKKATSLFVPKERFSDIVGREEIKHEFNKVVEYICTPDKFDRAGIQVERGYLLAGDPQTGKTLMARALAGEITASLEQAGKKEKVRLFEITAHDLIKKGIGFYMDLCRYYSPCILFIEEIDLLGLQRDRDTKMLNEFLVCMSGSLQDNEKDQIIILAATNKPENLDFALRQHGRFGKVFWFDKPVYNDRMAFFKREMNKRCMDTSQFDLTKIVEQTEACNYGDLVSVVRKALMHAKLQVTPVSQRHFEEAIDQEVHNVIDAHNYAPPKDKLCLIATHQGGRAFASVLLKPTRRLAKVTVLPVTQHIEEEHVNMQYQWGPSIRKKEKEVIHYGGMFSCHQEDSLDLISQEEAAKECKIALAGNIAQKLLIPNQYTCNKNDKRDAFKLAKTIVLEGLDEKELPKVLRQEKLNAAYELLEQYEKEISILLKNNLSALKTIIEKLIEEKSLSLSRIESLLKPYSFSYTA